MEKDAFAKLRIQFIQADLDKKIEIYSQTAGLTGTQYKELLQHYPFGQLHRLEAAFE